uniref:Uncharacterized protein n=1 Tax=Arundo donax TaxID=35708 RepID=A0A0A9ADN0_ARUDO
MPRLRRTSTRGVFRGCGAGAVEAPLPPAVLLARWRVLLVARGRGHTVLLSQRQRVPPCLEQLSVLVVAAFVTALLRTAQEMRRNISKKMKQ